jgi:hypothetical protein
MCLRSSSLSESERLRTRTCTITISMPVFINALRPRSIWVGLLVLSTSILHIISDLEMLLPMLLAECDFSNLFHYLLATALARYKHQPRIYSWLFRADVVTLVIFCVAFQIMPTHSGSARGNDEEGLVTHSRVIFRTTTVCVMLFPRPLRKGMIASRRR